MVASRFRLMVFFYLNTFFWPFKMFLFISTFQVHTCVCYVMHTFCTEREFFGFFLVEDI